jgi:hypothetical protein
LLSDDELRNRGSLADGLWELLLLLLLDRCDGGVADGTVTTAGARGAGGAVAIAVMMVEDETTLL